MAAIAGRRPTRRLLRCYRFSVPSLVVCRINARQSVDGAVDEDGAADGPIAPRKLEVQRYIVNGKKPGRVDRSRADEQKDGVDIPHKLAGEDASRHAAAGQLPSSSSA